MTHIGSLIVDPGDVAVAMRNGALFYDLLSNEGQTLVEAAPSPAVLAKAAIEHIEGHSAYKWEQAAYWHEDLIKCETSCCIAGFLALSVGFEPSSDAMTTSTGDQWPDVASALIGHHYKGFPKTIFHESQTAAQLADVLESIAAHDPDRQLAVYDL